MRVTKHVIAASAAALTKVVLATTISNVIIFGDSLSDGGNLPESNNGFVANPPTLDNSDPEYYVPISNPSDISATTATPPGVTTNYNWPSVNPSYLSPQASINGEARNYRSFSWPQFLTAYAMQEGKLAHDAIVPSYLIESKTGFFANVNVNYAWGYALSTAGCADETYKTLASCDSQSILAARKAYVETPNKTTRAALEIPGVPEQVQLFLQDYKAGKVSIHPNSMVNFWVGGNDLIHADEGPGGKMNIGGLLQFMFAKPAQNTISAIKALVSGLKAADRPAKVYMFNLTDPGLTPDYYSNKDLKGLANFLVGSYNFWLSFDVAAYNNNKLNTTKIDIININQLYKKESGEAYFKTHLGQACQISGGDYSHATTLPSDKNCAGFMYWNGVHPAAPLQMLTAYNLLHPKQSTKLLQTTLLNQHGIKVKQQQQRQKLVLLLTHLRQS